MKKKKIYQKLLIKVPVKNVLIMSFVIYEKYKLTELFL